VISVIPTGPHARRGPSGSFCAVGDHLAMSGWGVMTNKAVGDGGVVGDGRGLFVGDGCFRKTNIRAI
jgi:hypothetical protein